MKTLVVAIVVCITTIASSYAEENRGSQSLIPIALGNQAEDGRLYTPRNEGKRYAASCGGTDHLCYWGDYYWCCPRYYTCGAKGQCYNAN